MVSWAGATYARTMKVSDRAGINPFYVMEVMKAADERKASGEHVLHLEVGQPSTQAPEGVLAAAQRALVSDRLGYTSAAGMPELRQRIAQHYATTYGEDVDPSEVFVTVGASGACILAFMAAFDPGDTVVVTEPGYPCYRNMLEAFGIEVHGLPVGPETRWAPTPELLEPLGHVDGIVLASPANPTGTMLTDEQLSHLVQWCEDNRVRLISDEIYHGITYDRPAATARAFGEHPIIVQSFSKYFSMTGWRVGWMLMPDDLRTGIERLAQNLFIAPPTLAQHAGLAAFDCEDEIKRNIDRYQANRDILVAGLRDAGFETIAPADGAFYVYADIAHLSNDAQVLCAQWLAETGVAATPGIDFDPRRGHQFVRFSYSESTEDIAEAVARLTTWVADH